jgi:hypothetical protein
MLFEFILLLLVLAALRLGAWHLAPMRSAKTVADTQRGVHKNDLPHYSPTIRRRIEHQGKAA